MDDITNIISKNIEDLNVFISYLEGFEINTCLLDALAMLRLAYDTFYYFDLKDSNSFEKVKESTLLVDSALNTYLIFSKDENNYGKDTLGLVVNRNKKLEEYLKEKILK